MLPTGVKLGAWGKTRATAPSTVKPTPKGLRLFSIEDVIFLPSMLLAGGGEIRIPQRLRRVHDVAGPAAPYEQRVAEAVQITQVLGRHGLLARQQHAGTLGPAAHGAAQVQLGV